MLNNPIQDGDDPIFKFTQGELASFPDIELDVSFPNPETPSGIQRYTHMARIWYHGQVLTLFGHDNTPVEVEYYSDLGDAKIYKDINTYSGTDESTTMPVWLALQLAEFNIYAIDRVEVFKIEFLWSMRNEA